METLSGLGGLHRDQRGITGLETAIVLIAFVVVTYLDTDQAIICLNPGTAFDSDVDTAECRWATSWVIGTSDLLDPGE